MKKKILIILVAIGTSAAVFGGCGGKGTSGTESVANEKQKVGFENNVLTTDKMQIKIKDYKVIPADKKGNSSSYNKGNPIITFFYDVTNFSDEDIDTTEAWYDGFEAYQGENEEVSNRLDLGFNDEELTAFNVAKKNETASGVHSYILKNLESPVFLKARKDALDYFGSQSFEIIAAKFENAEAIETESETTTVATTTIETTASTTFETTTKRTAASYIDRLEVAEIDNNKGFYDVYLTNDCTWDGNMGLQEEIAHEAIKMAIQQRDKDGVSDFWVMVFKTNDEYPGGLAFSWDGQLSIKEKFYKEDGKLDYELGLLKSQLEEWGYYK